MNRRDIALRQAYGVLAAIGLAMVVVRCAAGCHALTPAEQEKVASDGMKLSTCAANAHLCKLAQGDAGFGPCWDEFDACLIAHGFADAGDAR